MAAGGGFICSVACAAGASFRRHLKGAVFLRLHSNVRAVAASGAVALMGLAVIPATSIGAQADTEVKITNHRLHVIAGHKARVNGELAGAAGRDVRLERRAGHGWHTEDSAKTNASGHFALGFHPGHPGSSKLRVRFPSPTDGVAAATPGVGPVVRGVGRLNVYRKGTASVYGPGGAPRLWREPLVQHTGRRQQDAALRHEGHVPLRQPQRPRPGHRPRTVRRRPRLGPHDRDRQAPGIPLRRGHDPVDQVTRSLT